MLEYNIGHHLTNEQAAYIFRIDKCENKIDMLIQMLEKYPLCPTFEYKSNFYREYKPLYGWTDSTLKYKGCISFWGNFDGYAYGFDIKTDEKEIIDKLITAISKNIKSDKYLKAKERIKNEKLYKSVFDKLWRHTVENNVVKYLKSNNKYDKSVKWSYDVSKNIIDSLTYDELILLLNS